MVTAKQIAALKYLIFNAKTKDKLAKRILAFLIHQSNMFTKEVCLTLWENREGYTADEIDAAAMGVSSMQSSDGTTHLDAVLEAMGVKLKFSFHYGDFDPNRKGDPMSAAGQFAGAPLSKVSRPELAQKGMPMRYTFWFSKKDYSRKATLVTPTREELEKINLAKPGLYPNSENQSYATASR